MITQKHKWTALLLAVCLAAASLPGTAGAAMETAPAESVQTAAPDGTLYGEAVAAFETEAEAQAAAVHYGLELSSFAHGIAVFTVPQNTDGSLQPMMHEPLPPDFFPNRLYSIPEEEAELLAAPGNSDRPQYHHREIHTEQAWEKTRGEGVTVAVIDTGADIDHPEYADRISPRSYNSHTDQVGIEFVQDLLGHGTHVCGIIAATDTDHAGTTGVAPGCELLVIKADRPDHRFDMATLIRSINYAVEEKADVINMSLGAPYTNGPNKLEQQALRNAIDSGAVVVCAAGNDRRYHAGYPAAYPETIAVSATRENAVFDRRYSNYGPEIDLSAPGTDILSTWADGFYGTMSGTSMACPVVSGIAALLKAENPSATSQQIRERLCATATEAGALGRDDYMGRGFVNAGAALADPAESLTVTYDLNLPGAQSWSFPLRSGMKLIEPQPPRQDGKSFLGWYDSPDGAVPFSFLDPVSGGDLTLYARWKNLSPDAGGSLTGIVTAYDPKRPCYIRLWQNGSVQYSALIPAQDQGNGFTENRFALEKIEPGVYDLTAEKAGHLTVTVRGIRIGEQEIDLSRDSGRPWQTIELLPGDVNRDGWIDLSDANEIWNEGNYNQEPIDAENPLADVNADGIINRRDLDALRQEETYNRSAALDRSFDYQAQG